MNVVAVAHRDAQAGLSVRVVTRRECIFNSQIPFLIFLWSICFLWLANVSIRAAIEILSIGVTMITHILHQLLIVGGVASQPLLQIPLDGRAVFGPNA